MEALIIGIITGLLQTIPAAIEAIQASKTMTDDQKKKLLDELDLRLLQAKQKVAQVRFKKVD